MIPGILWGELAKVEVTFRDQREFAIIKGWSVLEALQGDDREDKRWDSTRGMKQPPKDSSNNVLCEVPFQNWHLQDRTAFIKAREKQVAAYSWQYRE